MGTRGKGNEEKKRKKRKGKWRGGVQLWGVVWHCVGRKELEMKKKWESKRREVGSLKKKKINK